MKALNDSALMTGQGKEESPFASTGCHVLRRVSWPLTRDGGELREGEGEVEGVGEEGVGHAHGALPAQRQPPRQAQGQSAAHLGAANRGRDRQQLVRTACGKTALRGLITRLARDYFD
jgi:hypothetical protein